MATFQALKRIKILCLTIDRPTFFIYLKSCSKQQLSCRGPELSGLNINCAIGNASWCALAPAGGGSAGAYGSSQGVKDVLGSLLSAVTLAAPTDQEQLAIMEALFPDLTHLLPCAMAVLHLVKRAAGQVAASQAVTW